MNYCITCNYKLTVTRIKRRISDDLYEIEFIDQCAFCRGRERKIEKIKKQINDLQWVLHCMGEEI